MKLRVLPLGLLCAALALAPVLVGPTAPPASANDPQQTIPTIKIMLGGDSITQGFDGDYTWRYRLYKEFQRQHRSVNFVGPRRYTYGGANHYAVNYGWDMDHDATGGTRLRTELNNIVADMADTPHNGANTPDVLVALYGTTDLLPRAASDPSKTVPLNEEIDDLRTYIQDAREVNANVDIVLGEVTTRRIPNRQAFNDALHVLAGQESNKSPYVDSRVVVADLDYPGWDPNKNTYDTTHPTPVGEAIIAEKIAAALRTLGVLPQNPAISTVGLRYNPPWAPRIRVSRTRRIVVNWAATKFLNKPQKMRIWVKDLRTRKAGMSAWTIAPQYVSPAKRPGRYQIRIQGRRQAMISPWSRTWTVTVRAH
jgi:lysophospholipase L1-like esterase